MIEAARTAAPGAWLLDAGADWWDLVRFGPPGFEVYVRVAFDHSDDPVDTPDLALDVLAARTRTATAYAAVWEGWTGAGRTPAAPVLDVPNRRMLLFCATTDELRQTPAVTWGDGSRGVPPHLAWPEDRAWCFACEVDEDFAFTIGCDRGTADALAEALPGRVTEAAYGADLPLWRD